MLRDISGYNVRIAKPHCSRIITEQWPVVSSVSHCSSLALIAVSRALEQAPASIVDQTPKHNPLAEHADAQGTRIREGETTGELFTDVDQLIDTQTTPEKPTKKEKDPAVKSKGGKIITQVFTFVGSLFEMSGEKETGNNASE